MGRSLRDLFEGSEFDESVKKETETFIEQETSGLRVKSLVELNNPLIYGNEATRIALRSTPTLDTMKEATSGEMASVGLLGKGISKLSGGKLSSVSDVRNKINGLLGIPTPLIPTRVADKLEAGKSVQEVLDQKNGTEFGKLLKQSGGGNFKTLGTKALGKAIQLGKDKLRGAVFGSPTTIGTNVDNSNPTYTDENTYSDVKNEEKFKDDKSSDDILLDTWESKRINLANYSPVYGVDKKSDLWNTELGETLKKDTPSDDRLALFDSETTYTGTSGDADTRNSKAIDSNKLGIGRKNTETKLFEDTLNLLPIDNGEKTTADLEKSDLVPFWIGRINSKTKTHFRALLNGISETVSPSWNSDTFFGNPYEFHTYVSISRGISFSLQIYCMSEAELINNWHRISKLTEYTYPDIDDKIINPPIIDFRLGDIYNKKIGFIESLSYTYPDNGTWEISEGKQLPKFIDVSISIKFIEQSDTVKDGLYSNPKSTENETSFSEEQRT